MRSNARTRLCVMLILFGFGASLRSDLADDVRASMRQAGRHWATKVASHGGYVWEYSTDFVTRRRGESKDLPLSTVWVQAGTPMVGQAFLRAYRATGETLYLDAAVAAAECLAYGQLESGGWTYSIEFDPKLVKHHYHHFVGKKAKGRNTTTFDDNNTQSATRFLMDVDALVDNPKIDDAVARALACFLAAQYKGGNWDGAWPQRYVPPKKGYGRYPTFNDGTMGDCVKTMVKAYRQYDKPEYLDSVKRCLDFYLRSQIAAPQASWAQQYDSDLKPAWARRFEPPSVTGGESCGNCHVLMDMYVEFGDQTYLDAVGRCVEWYRNSRIGGREGNGRWARFYELKTNKPLYFTRTYKLTFKDDDLPVHYSFQSNYGVDRMIRHYEALRKKGRDKALAQRARTPTAKEWRNKASVLAGEVKKLLADQDEEGRWVRRVPKRNQFRDSKGRIGYRVDKNTMLQMIYSRTFVRNMRTLSDYLTATQKGPKITDE